MEELQVELSLASDKVQAKIPNVSAPAKEQLYEDMVGWFDYYFRAFELLTRMGTYDSMCQC